jgi:hypothetical protein
VVLSEGWLPGILAHMQESASEIVADNSCHHASTGKTSQLGNGHLLG